MSPPEKKMFEMTFTRKCHKKYHKIWLTSYEFLFNTVGWKPVDPNTTIYDWNTRSACNIIGDIDSQALRGYKVQNMPLRVNELGSDRTMPQGKEFKVVIKSAILGKRHVWGPLREGNWATRKVILFAGKVESIEIINSDPRVECHVINDVVDKSACCSITITLCGNIKKVFNADKHSYFSLKNY